MADSFGAKGAGAWDYALRIYAQEGVAPACLLLQDCVGVDVTVLLHAMYHAANSSAVGGNEVAARLAGANLLGADMMGALLPHDFQLLDNTGQ